MTPAALVGRVRERATTALLRDGLGRYQEAADAVTGRGQLAHALPAR